MNSLRNDLLIDTASKPIQAMRVINEAFERNKMTQKNQANKSNDAMAISQPNAVRRKTKTRPIEHTKASIETFNLLGAFRLNHISVSQNSEIFDPNLSVRFNRNSKTTNFKLEEQDSNILLSCKLSPRQYQPCSTRPYPT